MFRSRTRAASPFIDWTDYRVDGPLRAHTPWRARRRHRLLRFLLFVIAAIVVARLLNGRRRSGWL